MSGFGGHDKSEMEPARGETADQERVRIRQEQQARYDSTPEAVAEREASARLQEFCTWLRARRGATDVRWTKDGNGPTRELRSLDPQWGDELTVHVFDRSLTIRFTSNAVEALANAGLRPNCWAWPSQTKDMHWRATRTLVETPRGSYVDGETATNMGIAWEPLP